MKNEKLKAFIELDNAVENFDIQEGRGDSAKTLREALDNFLDFAAYGNQLDKTIIRLAGERLGKK